MKPCTAHSESLLSRLLPHGARVVLLGLIAAVSAVGSPAQQSYPTITKTAVSVGTTVDLGNSLARFEHSSVGHGTFLYAQDIPVVEGSPWSMSGSSGISNNASGFTGSNPNAPEGTRVAFLQVLGSIACDHDFAAGTYRLRFYAAQRLGNSQTVRVTIGGTHVFEAAPRAQHYDSYCTRPITFTSQGVRSVVFSGTNDTGDHTAFIDQVQVETVSDWDSTATWGNSSPPGATDNVLIPSGVLVAAGVSATAATVRVNGELLASNRNATLNVRWMSVKGQNSVFEVGTEGSPFQQSFVLTLTGFLHTEAIDGAGTKFLMTMNGGRIDMHGKRRKSWVKLSQTANVSDTTLTFAEAVDWEATDKIVLAPSGAGSGPGDVEQRQINTVAGDGLSLTLTNGLGKLHFGGSPMIYNSMNGVWSLDQRAEVGLLSHNVRIVGEDTNPAGFGGHVMIMHCPACTNGPGFGRFSNVEFDRMGQKNIPALGTPSALGRYPIHWHMQLDSRRSFNYQGGLTVYEHQYIKDSSIHHSFNRAVTIHGSDYVTVAGNVAYEHLGHGVFLEDASERYNTIQDNLVLCTRAPVTGEELLPSDNMPETAQNRSPAAFWITNPLNTVTGNVAAGTDGTGYWLAFPQTILGMSYDDHRNGYYSGVVPHQLPLIEFSNNTSHHCGTGLDVNDGIDRTTHAIVDNFAWEPPSAQYIDDFKVYGNKTALYAGGGTDRVFFRNNILADNHNHVVFACPHTVQDSVLVRDSGNSMLAGSGLGYIAYDGPGRMINDHLDGFDSFPGLVFVATPAHKHVNHLFTGITMSPNPVHLYMGDYDAATGGVMYDPILWGVVLRDTDGSLCGTANRSIVSNHRMVQSLGDAAWPHNNGSLVTVSQRKFGWLTMAHAQSTTYPNITYQRFHNYPTNTTPDVTWLDNNPISHFRQLPSIVYETAVPYHYDVTWASTPTSPNFVAVRVGDLDPGDVTILVLRFPGATFTAFQEDTATLPTYPNDADLRAGINGPSNGANGYYLGTNNEVWLRIKTTNPTKTIKVSW